jgi:DNA-binding GntR family transcriptional regulator
MQINSVSLGAQTYELLLGEILAGKRPEGQKISEEPISSEFGISRTPAREALMRLATDGLIERAARKGCRINRIDLDQQRDLFQCRALVEALVLKLGFNRIPLQGLRDIMTALQQARRGCCFC